METVRRTDFFQRLLDMESRIDSRDLGWYTANLDTEAMDYWAVRQPGRLVRSVETGAPLPRRCTIAEFLAATGVLDLFQDRETIGLAAVQAAVINPWGFVGFQFGEPLLIDLQYYRPAMEDAVVDGQQVGVPSFYASTLPDSTWRDGKTSVLYQDEATGRWRIGTDVNRWQGTFTGRDGVHSFDDLRTYDCQLAILRRSLRHTVTILDRHFATTGCDIWTAGPDVPSPASLLGAAHLAGPFGVVAYLEHGRPHHDEAGTSMTTYLEAFADVTVTPHDLGVQ
ncbi:hypothetical protein [Kutzneria sp. NPDC051319]|uniref:hypothetical protein n=1 Tax=Kutzneria sp. NPDC051319 TaxID=3155047 RepID=UPI00341FDBCA